MYCFYEGIIMLQLQKLIDDKIGCGVVLMGLDHLIYVVLRATDFLRDI